MPRTRLLLSLLILAGLLVSLVPGALGAPTPTVPDEPVVIRLYYDDQAHLDAVAGQLDIWALNRAAGYAWVAVRPAEYQWLLELGYRVEIDPQKTALLGIEAPLDPRYYYFDDDYENSYGRYVVDFLQTMNSTYPDIVELLDIGDAWEASHAGHHRDLWVLRITNEDAAYGDIADKPVFFLHAEVHAREVSTPELAIRYIKYLTSGYKDQGGYGVDADVTWLVDWHTVYVEVMVNPDGHRVNEENTGVGYWGRRKNMDSDDGCTDWESWGVDLNRNHNFKWGCCGGSSGDPCDETYRGPTVGSEPETSSFQDFLMQVIPDQNGPNGDDEVPPAAPITTTGYMISLHSYADEILWPWGWTNDPAPNDAELYGLARKMAAIDPNYYIGSGSLYAVDGTTRDWSYGKLGIPSYVFEVGPDYGSCGGFFPAYGCQDGEDGMTRNFWAENRPVFLYAHKTTRQPYSILYGPDTQNLTVSPNPVPQGTPVDLTALITDHRYSGDPLAPVGAAEYFIDAPGIDGTGEAMAPEDGGWGETSETAIATVDTSGLSVGRHYILVHGLKQGTSNWGPLTAIFLDVEEGGPCAPVEILDVVTETAGCTVDYAVVVSGTEPFDYAWDFGAFGSSTEPAPTVAYGLPGTYAYTLTVTNCITGTATAQGTVTVECCVPPSAAALEYTPAEPLVGEEVVFTGTVESNRPVTYTWAFGDGGVGSGAVVTHTYEAGGSYEVTMEAANECGVAEVTETVAVCAPVTGLDFTWVPDPAPVDTWIAFHAAAEGTAPIGYAWAFGDGGTGSGANVSHRYTAAGTYTVVVTGTNCGGDVVVEHAVQVVPAGCDPVHEVELAWAPALPLVGEVVVFTGTAAGDEPIGYAWAFGDGGVGSGAEASHAYAAAGVYTVTLTAANCGGVTAEAEGVVTVAALPCAEVEIISVTAAVNGCRVQYAAEVSGDPLFSYLWAFGDGLTSTVAVPTHIYGSTGVYSGTLEVWNCGGVGHDTYAYVVAVDCAAPTEWSVYLPVVFK